MRRLLFRNNNCHLLVLLLACTWWLCACQKDDFITSKDAYVSISQDSIKFDTVFTSVGSVTQSFKIFNNNNQKIRLSSLKLNGGANSPFRININGIPAVELSNFDIPANDSIYVFVSATIDPTTANLPFLVADSMLIQYNGNEQKVQLQAFGQNANFLRNRVITGQVTWNNQLPYVLLGSLQIDTGATLTILPGCRIYSHAGTPILVDGTLQVNGTLQQKVVFSGDRLEDDYKNLPGSWAGIYFRETSVQNKLQHTDINNAYQAIVVEKPAANSNPKLILQQCSINNASEAGLLCVNSSLRAENTLISNCASNRFTYGGDYALLYCTVTGISNLLVSHKQPSIYISDFKTVGGIQATAALNMDVKNCIVWGEGGIPENEIVTEKIGSNNFLVNIDHCLFKAASDPANSTITDAIRNETPLFDSINIDKNWYNFRISNPLAPGIGKGIPIPGIPTDQDEKSRNPVTPDLGCFEHF